MSIKPVKIPGVGMRNVKTALAAAFCALAYYFIGRSPAFACIGAIFGMGSDMEDSRKNGGNRLFGTLIGGLLGMLLHLPDFQAGRRVYALARAADVHRHGDFDRALPDGVGRRRAARRRGAVHPAVQHAGGILRELRAVSNSRYDHRRSGRVGGELCLPAGLDAALERTDRGAEGEMRRVKAPLKTRRRALTNGSGKRIMVELAGR